jgi:Domain of unknown function (DUF6285)
MQDPPEKEALLFAIARFLEEDVRPLVKDPRVNFRILIATHLAATVASECRTGAADEAAALARLRAIYTDSPEASFRALEARLAADIRAAKIAGRDAAVVAHVKATLLAKLAVNSPRFDTRTEIE